MKDNITKEEFIAIVNSAMQHISNALQACDDVPEKYISLCCIDDRMSWNTYPEEGEEISAIYGYPGCEDEWEVHFIMKVKEAEDAEV